MAKAAQVVAIVFGVLAVGCIITALVTSNWMKACANTEKIKDTLFDAASFPSSDVDFIKSKFSVHFNVCFEAGLFKISLSFAPYFSTNFPIKVTSLNSFMQIAGGLLVGGLFYVLLGIGTVAMGVLSMSENKLRKKSATNKHWFGIAMMTLGTLCLFVGMTIYTVPQTKELHNSTLFTSQLDNMLQRSFPNFGSSRTKIIPPSSIDLSPSKDFKGMSYQSVKGLLMSLDPMFDYSFFLAWIGCALALLATIVGALAFCKVPEYNHDKKYKLLV